MIRCRKQQVVVTYGKMGVDLLTAASERELAAKTAKFLKAEMKRAGVTYAEMARRLAARGLQETEASIASKLARGTFAATFLLSALAALELEGMRLEDL